MTTQGQPHYIDFDKILWEKHGIPNSMKTKGKKNTSRRVTGGKETSELFKNKESEKKRQEKSRAVENSLGWSSVPICSICKYPSAVYHTTVHRTKYYCKQCAGAILLKEELLKK